MALLQAAEDTPTIVDLAQYGSATEFRRMEAWLVERISASVKKPSAEIVALTPVLAKLLLDRNAVNRPISVRNSSDLASDIANDRFEFNGESIIISNTGVLLDGQHRCEQVIATGKPITTVIVFGPKTEARFTIDIGKNKSVSNFLAMKGRSYTHALGTAVNYHLQWREFGMILSGSGGWSTRTRPTKAQILTAADEMRGIDASVDFTAQSMKSVGSHGVLSFCHYVFTKKASRETADHFMTRLMEGDGLSKGDPILYCRNRLIGLGRGYVANARAELLFKCWNAHRTGQTIQHLKLTGGALPKVER